MKKNVIILTKSEKNGGFCVSGIDIKTSKFIRLVSEDCSSKYALSKKDMLYEDGSEIKILDIVTVMLKGEQISWYQPENYIIDNGYYFENIGISTAKGIVHYSNCEPVIFYDTENSISEIDLKEKSHIYSLTLIGSEVFKVRMHNNEYGKRRLKASIKYNDQWYNNLIITDPDFIGKYYEKVRESSDQSINFSNILSVISLGEVNPKDSKHYKLVASVI